VAVSATFDSEVLPASQAAARERERRTREDRGRLGYGPRGTRRGRRPPGPPRTSFLRLPSCPTRVWDDGPGRRHRGRRHNRSGLGRSRRRRPRWRGGVLTARAERESNRHGGGACADGERTDARPRTHGAPGGLALRTDAGAELLTVDRFRAAFLGSVRLGGDWLAAEPEDVVVLASHRPFPLTDKTGCESASIPEWPASIRHGRSSADVQFAGAPLRDFLCSKGSETDQEAADVTKLKNRMTYANVMATIAAVIAVAGGTAALAGVRIAPKNSVTTKSIRQNNVTSRDLTGIIRVSASSTFTDPAPPDGNPTGGSAQVACPTGARVISGGGSVDNDRAHLTNSGPLGEGWSVRGAGDGTNTVTITAVAKCLVSRVQKPSS
jgi:hypothetical protein